MKVVEPVFHVVEPLVTEVGWLGAAVSIRTVPPAVGDAGQADALPSASLTWNSTYSLPST